MPYGLSWVYRLCCPGYTLTNGNQVVTVEYPQCVPWVRCATKSAVQQKKTNWALGIGVSGRLEV